MKAIPLVILLWLLPVMQSTAADSRISDIRAEYQAIRNALPTLKEKKTSPYLSVRLQRGAKQKLIGMQEETFGT